MHAAEIGGVDIFVTILAGGLLELCRRTLDDRMRAMAVRAYGGRRIAAAHQRRVNAALPFLEPVDMASAAGLICRDRLTACALDVLLARWMRGRIDVGMAAGAGVGERAARVGGEAGDVHAAAARADDAQCEFP